MTLESDLDWASVKFVFYDTGSNAKNNLYTLLKFIDQRFVNFIYLSRYHYLFNNLFYCNVETSNAY